VEKTLRHERSRMPFRPVILSSSSSSSFVGVVIVLAQRETAAAAITSVSQWPGRGINYTRSYGEWRRAGNGEHAAAASRPAGPATHGSLGSYSYPKPNLKRWIVAWRVRPGAALAAGQLPQATRRTCPGPGWIGRSIVRRDRRIGRSVALLVQPVNLSVHAG
jgi:hypothetical protein